MMTMTEPCDHLNFSAEVGVHRLATKEGGPITSYMAEIRVKCAECGRPFQFHGLEPGIDLAGARVSLDGLEANIAISPAGTKPNPFQRLAFGVRNIS